MNSKLCVRFGGHTSAGVKPLNQDAFAAHLPEENERLHKGAVAAIADGVSSGSLSHIASQTSVRGFLEDYFSTPESWTVQHSASRVLTGLNSWLNQQNASGQGAAAQMLCTFSALVIKSQTLHCFHVGDSRIYRYHQGNLEQLTRDHTREEGGGEYLLRALGGERHLKVDYSHYAIDAGDVLLMTTDGVHGVLDSAALKAHLNEIDDPETIAQAIVNEALAQGSRDNLTALLVLVDELPKETLEESHARLMQLPVPPVMQVGNKIDGYEVLEVIFSGTRSHMYRVKDIESGRIFVLKAPSENFAEDPLYLDGFIREEWVGRRIDHPNVMKTYEPLRPKHFLYYLGEHIEGGNLREWMQEHPKPELTEVRALVKQIIQGLRAFQRASMVHQDIKPENIMINRDGQVKILDFGTVAIAGVDEIYSSLDKSVPQGSVNYVAPEYLIGEKGSFRSDLFSLAVMTYEMLSGELPYKERLVKNASIKSYSELNYIPLRQHCPNLPFWLEGCLRKALLPKPSQRYDAYSEFLQDLSVPNPALEAQIQHQPLIERNPILAWQILCAVLLLLNLVQLMM